MQLSEGNTQEMQETPDLKLNSLRSQLGWENSAESRQRLFGHRLAAESVLAHAKSAEFAQQARESRREADETMARIAKLQAEINQLEKEIG